MEWQISSHNASWIDSSDSSESSDSSDDEVYPYMSAPTFPSAPKFTSASPGTTRINITNCHNVIVAGGNIKYENFSRGNQRVFMRSTNQQRRSPATNKRTQIIEITDEDYYKMEARPRGLCLIIHNTNFKDGQVREGSNADLERLNEIFKKQLQFEVKVHQNMTATDMKTVMQDEAREFKSDYNCLVCIIMTHGKNGELMGTDNVLITVEELSTFFKPNQCENLIGKPKMFFIQACRGDEYQIAHRYQPSSEPDAVSTDVKVERTEESTPTEQAESLVSETIIPNEVDFLFGYATIPGFRAFRDTTAGSWYIQALADVLEKYAKSEDLSSMMTRVNRAVNEKINDQVSVQTPIYHNSLTKKVLFY